MVNKIYLALSAFLLALVSYLSQLQSQSASTKTISYYEARRDKHGSQRTQPSMQQGPAGFIQEFTKERVEQKGVGLLESLVTKGNGESEITKVAKEERIGYHNQDTPLQVILEKYEKEDFYLLSEQRRIIFSKRNQKLGLYLGRTLLKEYGAVFGRRQGDKEYEGDLKTPEGEFFVTKKYPSTKWYKALGLSYPAIEDAERGYSTGLITLQEKMVIVNAIRDCKEPPQRTRLGSGILVHGGGGVRYGNWTRACLGSENKDMDEIYEFAERGCDESGNPKTIVIITL